MRHTDPAPFLAAVAAAMSEPGEVGAVFAAFERAMNGAIGHRLFTIMRHDPLAGRNRRVHTSDPVAYPVSGFKPVNPDHPWTRRVLLEGRPWIGRDAADIAWAYPDHEKIAAMGLGSAMNLPVRWGGRTLGAVNLLHGAGHYTEADAVTGAIFAALAVPALLGMDATDSRRAP
ncbi:GAF domain-containing protein [Roseomonas sp. HF4]|uniref:GAF domain-containing protein n=1 Tax=Roseomonas sp. HF4 TaxID=2562313 RepID=UPI0010C02BFA|nr:GAF domain-containing protein [Roseomonas sp. HF4]